MATTTIQVAARPSVAFAVLSDPLHNPLQDWLIDRRNVEGLRRLKQLAERR